MTVLNNFSPDDLDWDKQDNMIPAIIQHVHTKDVLMLGYMTADALNKTIKSGLVTFHSRSKDALWTKGETSGNTLSCQSITMDCDNDTLLIQAIPAGPTCHKGTTTCFGETEDNKAQDITFLNELTSIIASRKSSTEDDTRKSYVRSLFESGAEKVAQKVGEEGVEVAIAHTAQNKDETREEASDLLFHLMILLEDAGLSLGDIVHTLKLRHASS